MFSETNPLAYAVLRRSDGPGDGSVAYHIRYTQSDPHAKERAIADAVAGNLTPNNRDGYGHLLHYEVRPIFVGATIPLPTLHQPEETPNASEKEA